MVDGSSTGAGRSTHRRSAARATVTRRGRHARSAVALAAIVVAVVAAIAVRTVTSSGPRAVATTTIGGEAAPGPADTARPHIWLSVTEVPASGAAMVAVVVNPTPVGLTFGVRGSVERWTGRSWVSFANWYVSLDSWGGFGDITAKDEAVYAIALDVRPHAIGGGEYFTTPRLAPGWYRVGYPGTGRMSSAWGIFHVSSRALRPVPVTNPHGASITVSPALLPPVGGEQHIGGKLPSAGVQTAGDLRRFDDHLASTVEIQGWTGRRWLDRVTLHVHPPVAGSGQTGEVAVTVGHLAPGTYRIVRHSATAGELTRVFGVTTIAPRSAVEPTRRAVPSEFRPACGHPGAEVEIREVPVTVSHAACELDGVVLNDGRYGGATDTIPSGAISTSRGLRLSVDPRNEDVTVTAQGRPGNA